jgi:hypothetical protein
MGNSSFLDSDLPSPPLSAAVSSDPHGSSQVLDYLHAILVTGLVLAHRPQEGLELGLALLI